MDLNQAGECVEYSMGYSTDCTPGVILPLIDCTTVHQSVQLGYKYIVLYIPLIDWPDTTRSSPDLLIYLSS